MERDLRDAAQLHDRAQRSSAEARQTILSISSGAVGVFFIALTSKADPALDISQRVLVAVGAISFGLAILFSIVIAKADAKRSYHRAKSLQSTDEIIKSKKQVLSSKMSKLRKLSSTAQLVTFAVGMISAILYTLLRAH